VLCPRTYWGAHDATWLKRRYPSPFTIALDIILDSKTLTPLSNDLPLNQELVKAPSSDRLQRVG